MVIIRMTWHVDSVPFAEALKEFTAIRPPEGSALRGGRSYRSRTGMTNTLALEWEFESLAKWEEFTAQFAAMPENAPHFRRFRELVPTGAELQVWDLVEST